MDNIPKTGSGGELIVDADAEIGLAQVQDCDKTKPEQLESLKEVIKVAANQEAEQSWIIAKHKIERFKPLPWFLWRLANSVFSKPAGKEELNAGMLLGLRRLVFAAASDGVLGTGAKVNDLNKALKILSPDCIAAVAVLHSVCRRLKSYPMDSLWTPILEDSIVNAQIGYEIGKQSSHLGAGRGLLVGLASHIGLAILIATGDRKQGHLTLEKISAGQETDLVSSEVYGCEPVQIAGMLLASCGCGPGSANELWVYRVKNERAFDEGEAFSWAAGLHAVMSFRAGKSKEIDPGILEILGMPAEAREELAKKAIKISRAGHSWQWLQ